MPRESFHKDTITVPLKAQRKCTKKVSLTSPQSKLDHSNYEIWEKNKASFNIVIKKQNLHIHLKQGGFHHQEVETVNDQISHLEVNIFTDTEHTHSLAHFSYKYE